MIEQKIYVRALLLHYWKKGVKAYKAVAEIRQVEGNVIGKTAAYEWYNRFEDGDFDLEDKPRSGRPPNQDLNDEVSMITKSSKFNVVFPRNSLAWF
jgi:transposase